MYFILFEIVPCNYVFINASHENSGINCGVSHTDKKDNNSSWGNSLGDEDDDREKLTNDWKYLHNPFDISTNSVCFSVDKVRADILHNGSILNKNFKVLFEKEVGSFYEII